MPSQRTAYDRVTQVAKKTGKLSRCSSELLSRLPGGEDTPYDGDGSDANHNGNDANTNFSCN